MLDPVSTGIKNFDHLLVSLSKKPTIPFELGGVTFQLKPKVTVEATLHLISSTNSLHGMLEYLISSLLDPGQADDFRAQLGDFDMEGLGEIVDWYVEAASGGNAGPLSSGS